MEQVTNQFDRRLTGGMVTLTVIIGDGQLGGSVMKLNGTPLDLRGDIVRAPIGDAADLDGRVLEVRTLVADVNLQSNWTSITYNFSNATPATVTADHKVGQDGAAVLYTTLFRFHRA